MDVQEIVLRLHSAWQGYGCVLVPPRALVAVGPATIGPGLFFSALGPVPCRIACLETILAPGETAHRYRVLLKPAPPDGLERFLAMLRTAGIELDRHDVRLLPEDWTSRVLDTRGAGWRVDVDASTVGRFTYLQEVGGVATEPASALLDFDLEGIALAVQEGESIDALTWGGGVTYGNLFASAGAEEARYAHVVADVARLARLLGLVEEEARAALAAGLSAPAYAGALSCAHLATLFRTRALVREEDRSVACGRDLARACARAYLAREKNG